MSSTTTEASPEIEQVLRQDRLGYATRNNFLDKATAALDDGADLNTLHPSGDTFLMMAIANNNADMMRLFVDRGADLEMKSKTGGSALDTAVEENNEAAVRLLVERGVAVAAGTENRGKQSVRDMLRSASTLRAAFLEAKRRTLVATKQAHLRGKRVQLPFKPLS